MCLTLCDFMDCGPPGSSVHGILQGRILEWVAIPFSRDLPDPHIKPWPPALQAKCLLSEPPGKFICHIFSSFLWLSNMTYFRKNTCLIDFPKAYDCVDHNKLWKILKEKGIPDLLTCLLRNLYTGQEAAARTGHGTTDWFQIGKGIPQGCVLSLLFNFHSEYIIRNVGWMKDKLESRVQGEISIPSDTQMTPRKQRGTKELLDEGGRGE